MESTLFLAQLWAPVLLALGAGVFVNREYYVRAYRTLENQTLTLIIFAMIAIPAGVAHIMFHNAWDGALEIIISLLGWGLLMKGIMFALFPKVVDKIGDWEADSKLVPFAGGFMLLLGAYLAWVGYLA
jgi:hypothetical protein